MDSSAEMANSFAMDEAHSLIPLFHTLLNVCIDNLPHLFRWKYMKIQLGTNLNFNRFRLKIRGIIALMTIRSHLVHRTWHHAFCPD